MIYLTFDSNIWIYSLDDSWKIENQLDYLEPWIANGDVKLLLPEIILLEWDNNKDKQVEYRKTKLREFFQMAEEILPTAFFSDYKDPNTQREIIENQLKRVKDILNSAEIIPICQEVEKKVISMGIDKKAPLHKKSSVADAIIIYSLIKYADENQGNQFFFISSNTEDFYDKNKQDIHSDLKPDFDRLNIKVFKTLNHLNSQLRSLYNLAVSPDFDQRRKERIQRKIKERIYNPEYEQITADRDSSFLINLKTLESILNESRPTKEQVIFVLALMDSDPAYSREFFKKLEGIHWFKILNTKGIFKPVNNPAPVQVSDGFQIPYWEPLNYLEKLSILIKEGKELQLVDELIKIIQEVSESPKDNFHTWTTFIEIIINLPNEKIPKEIFYFIPTWLSGRFHADHISYSLCKNLLTKFLPETPTINDIEKAEIILSKLFEVEKVGENSFGRIDGKKSFYSKVHLRHLWHALVDEKLTTRIVKYCSDNIILDLGKTIKKLLLDYPDGIYSSIIDGENEYIIKVVIIDANLQVFAKLKTNELFVELGIIPDFEDLNEHELREQFVRLINFKGISYITTDHYSDSFEVIYFALNNDLTSSFGFDSIRGLDEKSKYDAKELDVFSVVFRELLVEKVKYSSIEGMSLLRLISTDKQFRLPFFKRITLYVISENWKKTRPFFWELIDVDDPEHFFSKHRYWKDMYDLLKRVQGVLTKKELRIIEKIINQGPQSERKENDDINYWKLRWYSALSNIEPFKTMYSTLSDELKISKEHFENQGKVIVRSGSVAPITIDDFSQKNNQEIVKFILDFKPKDVWKGPNVTGLTDILKLAVQNEPEKFANEISLYKDIHYIYAYHIINGFQESWGNKKAFNWSNVLSFCFSYISDSRFYSGEFHLPEDSWKATSEWVVGAIANLLSAGLQYDENSLGLENLSIVREIINVLVKNLNGDISPKISKDYLTYTFNSTSGKVLRALLDYSLYRSRHIQKVNETDKWEPVMKALFEETLKKNIIDAYALESIYFEQFYFLDKEWITEQVTQNIGLNKLEWSAFFGGMGFCNPPFALEIYELFYPHYERAINSGIEIEGISDHGIIRHLTAFYFWGYEDAQSGRLISLFLNKAKTSSILAFINFISRQEDYAKSLETNDEKEHFESLILALWSYLSLKYSTSVIDEEQKILGSLVDLLVFINTLNEFITNLILKSIQLEKKYFLLEELIKTLIELQGKGTPAKTAEYIGRIVLEVDLGGFFSKTLINRLEILVEFMYMHGQKEVANAICEKTSRQGNMFLRDLYQRYN